MFSPSLRSFEYSMLITTEASKIKKWYSDQPYKNYCMCQHNPNLFMDDKAKKSVCVWGGGGA